MYFPAIPEIRVETTGDDVTYWLPARPLGKLRWIGVVPVGFSLLWISFLSRPLLEMVRQLSTRKQSGGVEYFFIIFMLGFAVVGCGPGAYGLLAMFGQCRMVWRDGRLTVSDYVGLFGWRRRMPRAAIRKLTVNTGVTSNGKAVTTGPLAVMAALSAEFERGKPRIVTMGYPREWLEAISTDLSARMARSQMTPPQIEVIDTQANPPQYLDVAEKPSDSRVLIQRQSASIVLEIPPAGLRKGSMGLFFFASFWCLFMVVATFVAVFGKLDAGEMNLGEVFLGFGLFWAIGLGMMAAAIHLGRRRASLTAGKSGLTVVQTGPFGVKRREFRRDEIAAIRADDSGAEVNGSHLIELQIHPVTGKKVGLLMGRDAGELRWMATELRNSLGVAAKKD